MRRRVGTAVLLALSAQGCHAYTPLDPAAASASPRAGAELQVDPLGAPAYRGRLVGRRGDTLVVTVDAVRRDGRWRVATGGETLVPPGSAAVAVRGFSPGRTALLVGGVAVGIAWIVHEVDAMLDDMVDDFDFPWDVGTWSARGA